jgi:hypothetical protein
VIVDQRLDLVQVRSDFANPKALIDAAPEHVELPIPA